MTILCIYHANCADGFGAAWAVREALGEKVEFHPGVYQDMPPDIIGRDVIMVDFSYSRPMMEAIARHASTVLILDHHKTASEELAAIPGAAATWERHLDQRGAFPGEDGGTNMVALFDMNRSGAGIAWDYFHPGEPRPPLINHLEDRDLWRFRMPGTREIQAAVFSYPYDFSKWSWLMMLDPAILKREGEAIERKHFKDIAELVGVMRRTMVIGGAEIPVANLPYTMTSDAGHQMATNHPGKMAACYWDTPGGRVFSLRSTDDGPDVSAIAKHYGGGGHLHAAGFRMPIGWEGDR